MLSIISDQAILCMPFLVPENKKKFFRVKFAAVNGKQLLHHEVHLKSVSYCTQQQSFDVLQ